ncbi:MAG: RNA polymerase sigma-54 factor, partial [Caedimonadaceae bacterium]
EELSSTTIRHMIKKIIDEEIPHDPVTDDKLVQIISRDGVLVARRTIAKYREEMKIPSSYERKKLKLSIL